MKSRNEILEDELLRPDFPGLRKWSAGLFRLATKLGLAVATGASGLTPEQQAAEMVALTWLLDERNSIETLREGAAVGRDRFFEEILPAYEFSASAVLMTYARQEMELTIAATEACRYAIERKPTDPPPGDAPKGN